MRVLDLFSGIGGFALACHEVGFVTTQFVEKEPFCQKILTKHFPGVPIHDDVTTFTAPRGAFDIITFGSPCFVAGTLVLTRAGLKPIEVIQKGEMVLTHKGRWRPVIQTMVKFNVPTRLVTGRGVPLVTTDDHPFWVKQRYRYGKTQKRYFTKSEWVKAQDLTTDHFGAAVLPEEVDTDASDEKLWLLGRYVADGYLIERKDRPSGGKVVFCVGQDKAGEFESQIDEYHATKTEQSTCLKYSVSRNNLYEECKQFGRGAENKRVPGWVLALPREKASTFLAGYLSGDGCCTNGVIRATTVSKELAFGLLLLFQKVYDRVPSLSFVKRPKKTVIEGRVVNQKDTWQVYLRHPVTRQTVNFTEGNYGLFQIKQNKPTGATSTVYNIGVADDESYVADGFVVHNCQDFSIANASGRGLEGERSGLFYEAIRIVREVQPKYCVFENVTGVFNRGFDRVLWAFAESGYDAEWQVVSAASMGAPHRRERLFVIAYPSRQRTGMEEQDSSRQERELANPSQSTMVRQGNGEIDAEGVEPSSISLANSDSIGRRQRGDTERKDSDLLHEKRNSSENIKPGSGRKCRAESLRPTPSNPQGQRKTGDNEDKTGTNQAPFLRGNEDAAYTKSFGRKRLGDAANKREASGEVYPLDNAGQVNGPGEGKVVSGFCRVDDGVSAWMDGTSSYWLEYPAPAPLTAHEDHRNARLKALGNAVTPQQALVPLLRIRELEDAKTLH